MKKWNGCSSETKKCLFCGKSTSDYVTYEIKGIELKINTHYECNKNIDDISRIVFKLIKGHLK